MENTSTLFDDYDTVRHVAKNLRILDGLLFLTAAILGLFGNVLVIISFAVSDKLKTKTNMFVVNLAFADILTSILMPIYSWTLMADIVYPVPQWIDTVCAFVIGATQVSIGCSLLNLAFISINRLILITKSREIYDNVFRVRNIAFFIFLIWLYPVTVVVTPLHFGIGDLGFDMEAHKCSILSNHKYSHTYHLILISMSAQVPVMVLYSYAKIFYFVSIHNEKRRKHQQREVQEDKSPVQ